MRNLTAITQLSTAWHHACAINSAGGLSCWGRNIEGQIGDGSSGGVTRPDTVLVDPEPRRLLALTAGGNAPSTAAVIDDSGRYVVYQSRSSNLVSGDSNGASDVFRFDRDNGSRVRVSADSAGVQINGSAIEPAVSGDGGLIVFVAPQLEVKGLLGESAKAAEARRQAGGHGVFLRNMSTLTTPRHRSQRSGGGLDPAGAGQRRRYRPGQPLPRPAHAVGRRRGDGEQPAVPDLQGLRRQWRTDRDQCQWRQQRRQPVARRRLAGLGNHRQQPQG